MLRMIMTLSLLISKSRKVWIAHADIDNLFLIMMEQVFWIVFGLHITEVDLTLFLLQNIIQSKYPVSSVIMNGNKVMRMYIPFLNATFLDSFSVWLFQSSLSVQVFLT